MVRTFFFISLVYGPIFAQEIAPEMIDPKVLENYNDYWHEHEQHNRLKLNKKKSELSIEQSKLRDLKKNKKMSQFTDLYKSLLKTITLYKKQLNAYSSTPGRVDALFQYMQVVHTMSKLLSEHSNDSYLQYENETLHLLEEIEENYQSFPRMDEVLYLKGLILEKRGQVEAGFKIWKKISSLPTSSIFGIRARVSIGDYYFEKDMTKKASQYYSLALKLIPVVSIKNRDSEKIKIEYRLIWAAYRSGQLKKVLQLGLSILSAGRETSKISDRHNIQADTYELVGDVLFEYDHVENSISFLTTKKIKEFAPSIGIHLMKRYMTANLNSNATAIGLFLQNNFSSSKEYPKILNQLAINYKISNKTSKWIDTLERLSLLLPPQGLWRKKFNDHFKALKFMEQIALKATMTVAQWHWNKALKNSSKNNFLSAASFYKLLLEHNPTHQNANKWLISQGNCFYYAGQYEASISLFNKLISRHNLTLTQSKSVYYQQILALERLWQNKFSQSSGNPTLKSTAQKNLTTMDQSIDRYVNKFSQDKRSIDLLLVGGSANRDQGNIEKALTYWQRSLAMNAKPAQRVVAIRGITFVYLREKHYQELIQQLRRFLTFEKWDNLGSGLHKELLGILSQTINEYAKKLGDKGSFKKAGNILLTMSDSFPSMPNNEQYQKDGAYYLALAGLWKQSIQRSIQYQSKHHKYLGDMIYLQARSYEYLMQFHDAAQTYWKLVKLRPRHRKSTSSIKRAIKLADAEEDYALAAEITEYFAKKTKKRKNKVYRFMQSSQYYLKAKHYTNSARSVKNWIKVAKKSEAVEGMITMAHILLKQNKNNDYINQLSTTSKFLDNNKSSFEDTFYKNKKSHLYYLMGSRTQELFEDIEVLNQKSIKMSQRLNAKYKEYKYLENKFKKSISLAQQPWSSASRYKLANASEDMADSFRIFIDNNQGETPFKTIQSYRSNSSLLSKLSQDLHSQNILLAKTNHLSTSSSKWVRKSHLRLRKFSKTQKIYFKPSSPVALHFDLPTKWR